MVTLERKGINVLPLLICLCVCARQRILVVGSFMKISTHNNCIARKQAAHQQEAIVPFFAWLKMKLEIGGKGVARGSGEILDNENQKQPNNSQY